MWTYLEVMAAILEAMNGCIMVIFGWRGVVNVANIFNTIVMKGNVGVIVVFVIVAVVVVANAVAASVVMCGLKRED